MGYLSLGSKDLKAEDAHTHRWMQSEPCSVQWMSYVTSITLQLQFSKFQCARLSIFQPVNSFFTPHGSALFPIAGVSKCLF